MLTAQCKLIMFPSNELSFDETVREFLANAKVIIAGDIDLNLFNLLRLTYIDSFIAKILRFGFFPVITISTMINEHCPAEEMHYKTKFYFLAF